MINGICKASQETIIISKTISFIYLFGTTIEILWMIVLNAILLFIHILKTNNKNFLASAFLLLAVLFTYSCSDDNPAPSNDDNGNNDGGGTKYIITSSPIASEGVAAYLLTVDDL